ncbi:polysaccharide deacetylase family protein [Methylocapsa aurea]|uniref:polysaccharide deacetylase family protein n=1 Tax=Methylocapsa aurea TaxID=663610 RepID=UPI000A01B849|nr:polysaccharide deacetylase family protein [Methylocapsa aurea]
MRPNRRLWTSGLVLIGFAFFQAPGTAAEQPAPCPPDALGVSRTLRLGTQGGWQAGLKTYPRSLALDDHEIVLTFDDGPHSPTTAKVLDALRKECVKATFFLVGHNAQALPDLVKREVAEGHTLGHHTFSHPDATLRRLSEKAAEAEITKGIEADEKAAYGQAAYSEAGAAPKTPFFRFPGFADTPALVAWLSARNIAVFGADFWASDWAHMTPEAQLNLVLTRLEKEGRGILLFHDTKQQTADMLPALLREMKQRGFKIVHIAPGSDPPPMRAAPEGWTSETEKIIAEVFAKQAGASKADADQRRPNQTPQADPSASGAPMGAPR